MKGSIFALAAVVSIALPTASQAQLTSVSPNCGFWLGVNVLAEFNPDAVACLGAFAGNDSNQQADVFAAISGAGWGTDVVNLGTTDSGSGTGPFSIVPDATSGTIVFDSPLTGNYILALKAGDSFSLYRFAFAGHTELFYTTMGSGINTNSNKDPQPVNGLSHVSLYGARVSVPEPESFALLATGLFGLGFVAVRRRRDEVA